MAGLLRKHVRAKPPRRILEIGAGDGKFMLAVARRIGEALAGGRADAARSHRPCLSLRRATSSASLAGASRQSPPMSSHGCRTCRGTALRRDHRQPVPAPLRQCRSRAAAFRTTAPLAPLLLATEPRRGSFPLAAARLLWAIGANDVTLHDAAASVRAGFAGKELSALWPAGRRKADRGAARRAVQPCFRAPPGGMTMDL